VREEVLEMLLEELLKKRKKQLIPAFIGLDRPPTAQEFLP
jgi:hypothetical protein